MELLRKHGWYCNSYKARQHGKWLLFVVVIMACFGLIGIKHSTTPLDTYSSLLIIFWFPIFVLLLNSTSDGIPVFKCMFKAKQVKLYPDYISFEDSTQSISVRRIKHIEYLGVCAPRIGSTWYSWNLTKNIGGNLCFRATLKNHLINEKKDNAVYFLVVFPSEFDELEIKHNFFNVIQKEMNLISISVLSS